MLLQNSPEKTEYSCLILPEKKDYVSFEGERVHILLQIKNRGKASWSSEEKNPCFLSYHILDKEGKIILYDNRRYSLPRKIIPAQSVDMAVTIRSPLGKGKYILEFDIVREGIAWFKDYGSKTSEITLLVKERKWKEDESDLTLDYGKYTKFYSSIPELNNILKLIRITLHQNEVEFKGRTGEIRGFSPGTNYPQIWLRDANTIIPASRYYYDKTFLQTWLEEHLAFQNENGSLVDWINSRGISDKNTTETDQEASAVQAAFQVFEILGPSWLEKQINNEKIIDKLEKALEFVLRNRLNREYGLLSGAHTADWGDVDMVDEDQQAIYVDEKTHWTADIYDQSMFYQACVNLARMFESLGKKKKASYWLKKSDITKKNTNKFLWNKDKGFYRIHIHLDSLLHDFDEEEIFAMGGNTTAMTSGLAEEEKCKQIIRAALKRQKSFKISTVSGTLLPPYPKNFFKHPLVDDPYEYQNGGQWDWFGGKLIYVMFEHGYSRLATEKLMEIVRKNLENRSFFEWDNREGIGQGSDLFCGGAGSIGRALFEGYFGVKLGREYLSLEPKAGKDSAKIHVYQPANDIFVAYEYNYEPTEKKLTFKYNSNFPHKGKIKILNLWIDLEKPKKEPDTTLEVLIDGRKTTYSLENKNDDSLILIETDFNHHVAEIKLRE